MEIRIELRLTVYCRGTKFREGPADLHIRMIKPKPTVQPQVIRVGSPYCGHWEYFLIAILFCGVPRKVLRWYSGPINPGKWAG